MAGRLREMTMDNLVRPPAAASLGVWLTVHDMSRFRFCATTGINPGMLWSWLTGRSTPSLGHAARIEQLTGIPPRAWLVPESSDNSNPEPML